MTPGRLTAEKQEKEQKLEADRTLVRSPLGVKDVIAGATAAINRKKREEQFGPMESVLTPGQQNVIGRLSAGVEKVTGSEVLASYVSRAAAPIKAGTGALLAANKRWNEKSGQQRANELPEITKKVGMAFVHGINSAVLRFVKSGSEAVIGRENTQKIASQPIISKFAGDITGRTPDEKIMTFQQIGEAVHKDALAHGASEQEAQKITSLAVIGAVFAENPIFPGKGVTKNTAEFIAKSVDPTAIKTRLIKEFPDFPTKATDEQLDIMANILVNVDRVQDVETVLNRIGFSLKGRLASKQGKSPAVQQRLAEISRSAETTSTLPSPTATTQKTLEIPISPKPAVGEGRVVTPKTPEEATSRYLKEVVQKNIDEGKPIVLGADDMKYHFGNDFTPENHSIYSKATFKIFEEEVSLSKANTVILTGGGPGAGKTDFLISPIKGSKFSGVVYDSNFSSLDGARNQLKVIRDAGKTPRVYGIIPNLDDARRYTILREGEGGHPVSDAAFARGHAGFPSVIKELLESGELKPSEVRLFDTRNIREKKAIVELLEKKLYAEDPLALVKELSYNEVNVRQQYTKQLFDGRTGRRLSNTGGRDRDVSVSSKIGTNIRGADEQRGSASVLQKGDEVTKPPKDSLKAPEVQKAKAVTVPKYTPEEYSLDQLAQQEARGDYALVRSQLEEDRTVSNLETVFADLKGVELKDLKAKFSFHDLENAKLERSFIDEAIRNDPAGGLVKYMSRTTGQLPEVTGKPTMTSLKGGKGQTVKNSKYGMQGDDINQTLFGRALETGEAQKMLDQHLDMVARRKEFDAKVSEISHNINLAKAKNLFVGKEKNRLARELATNLASLRAIVQAAERAGFRKGLKEGVETTTKKFTVVLNKNQKRRLELQRIKRQYNLSDTEWAKIRRQPYTDKTGKVSYRDLDYREIDDEAFSSYLVDVAERATARHERNIEKIIVDAIIQEKGLKKVDNLQMAMELPHVNKMSATELRKFAEQLNATEAGGEYLPARMMQTIRNTDIGDAKTIGEAQEKVAKQTNMPMEPVMGAEIDDWLRLPTLAARDPLHKLFVGDWIGSMVEMRSKKFHFKVELNSLKKAANASRKLRNSELRKQGALKQTVREKVFAKLVPEDKLVSQYLQPFTAKYSYHPNGQVKSKEIIIDPAIREQALSQMTKEEIAYAKFLERFFSSKWEQVAREAQIRWTLRGVKHSNYRGEAIESVYLPHATRGFLERWRDDGFFSTVRRLFSKEIRESKVDFNAYGDRGKVLGYEKWLRNNMVRAAEGKKKETGEILYSLNTAKVAEIYFEALEKKLVLDSLIPKVKLYEYLLGKRLQAPKHIGDPEGAEVVNSMLKEHINKALNTLKGQKAGGYFRQGGAPEGAVQALKIWISVKYLGVNVITQLVSGVGAQATSFAGIGLKAWTKGHIRAKTRMGRQLAQEYAGVVGEPPWFEIAKASNDAGDVFTSGLFYGFGSLQYRAQRQMFLGMLTVDEWKTGIITKARQKDIRIKMGEWHPMPGDESIQGATQEIKLVTMFMSWAFPAIQTTYFKNLPRVLNMVRRAKNAEDAARVIKTEEFQTLFRTVVLGAATAAFAYFIFNPDKNDKSQAGYMRRRAAEELSTVIQAITLWGIPVPGAIVVGYLKSIQDTLKILLTGERYTTAGPGHAAGDLKAPDALVRTFVPGGITQIKKMITGEPETPIKTRTQLKKEVLEKIESGQMSVTAAKEYYFKQIKNIEAAEKARRFELSEADYKKDLLKRIEAEEITIEEAKKEYTEYQKKLKEFAPEKFESNNDATFIQKIQIAAKALKTDPVTLFNAVFTTEKIRRMDNGKIILHRGKTSDPLGQRDWALEKRKEFGANADLRLDHTIPLQLGGDNSDSNLKLVPVEEWENYTPVENYLGYALRNGEITAKEAKDLILRFKAGKITEEQVYSAVDTR